MKAYSIAMLLSLFAATLPAQAESHPTPTQSISPVTQKINLNKADVSALTGSFKGIGKKRAEAIIAYRESHSGIKSIEELAEIKGFGQKFVDKNRTQLTELFVLE